MTQHRASTKKNGALDEGSSAPRADEKTLREDFLGVLLGPIHRFVVGVYPNQYEHVSLVGMQDDRSRHFSPIPTIDSSLVLVFKEVSVASARVNWTKGGEQLQ